MRAVQSGNWTMSITRRRWLQRTGAFAAGTLGTGVLAACAGLGQQPGATPETKVTQPTTIELWHWDEFFRDTMQKLGDRFTQSNPSVKVTVVVNSVVNNYYDKLQTAIVADASPAVVGVHPLRQHTTATSGMYRDLNRYIGNDKSFDKADFYDVGLKAHSWKGQQYGIPHDSALRLYYYNRDILEKEGVKTPLEYHKEGKWNWATYLDMAKRLTRDTNGDGEIDQFGTGGESAIAWGVYLSFLWQNQGDLFDAGYTKQTVTQAAAREAFTFMKEVSTMAPAAATGATRENGRVGIWQDWHPWSVLNASKFSYRYGVAPMVQGRAQTQLFTGGPAWGIPTAAKNPDSHWPVVKHLTSKESFTQMFQIAMMPARKSLDTDALWASNKNLPTEMRTAFQIAARTGRAMPRVSKFDEMNTALGQAITSFLRDQQSVGSATEVLARDLDRLLAESIVDPIK